MNLMHRRATPPDTPASEATHSPQVTSIGIADFAPPRPELMPACDVRSSVVMGHTQSSAMESIALLYFLLTASVSAEASAAGPARLLDALTAGRQGQEFPFFFQA